MVTTLTNPYNYHHFNRSRVTSFEKQRSVMSEPDKVAIATVLSALIVVDIVGNSLVCVIIKKNRDLRYVNKYVVKCQTLNV